MSLKIMLLSLLLGATSCNSTSGPSASWERANLPTSEKGEVLWVVPGHEGYKIAAVIALTRGGFEIFAAPELTYQRARTCGAAFVPQVRVCMEYIEVFKGLAPQNAMETPGWRDPSSILYYPLQVFPGAQGSALRVPNSETGIPNEIRIFQRGEGAWLIVITTNSLVYDMDNTALVEAHGEGK